MKYEIYFEDYLKEIEKTLETILPAETQHPVIIHQAMRYSVFPGGKRFRPVLTLASCEACGGKPEQAMIPSVSLELIHCYSLVHDDLPSLDNDDLRRGKLTSHKQFGEALAILAGDGLLTLAFQVIQKVSPSDKALKLLSEISTAAGTYGMIGGQVADLTVATNDLTVPMLDYISVHKTGKLITAAAVCGAIAAEASPESQEHILKYGEYIGLAFQLVDDLHDHDGYLKLMGSVDIIQKVRDLIAKAKQEIRGFGAKADKLHAIADYLLQRMPQTHALDR
ncbi:MAG: polyprenyl synthetase family protein [Candidatus Omnitrophica bacterium]|nr:polyprenyl synthetase family protein [Candidatus Omnitrophota bacterium]